MEELGLSTHYLHRSHDHPTGWVTVTVDASGQPEYVIHRPAAYDFPELSQNDIEVLLSPAPDWIYCGTLQQMSVVAHRLTMTVLEHVPKARRFYDVNLRIGCYTPELVHKLMSHATIVKVNEDEAFEIAKMSGESYIALEDFCRTCAERFGLQGICATRGDQGCAILMGNCYIEAPAYPVQVSDSVGAGDAFSAAFIHGLASGWKPAEVADFANRVGAVVASRPGAVPDWTMQEALSLK
jgi:fructokinase